MPITDKLTLERIHNLARAYPNAKEFSYYFIESPENVVKSYRMGESVEGEINQRLLGN